MTAQSFLIENDDLVCYLTLLAELALVSMEPPSQ